MTQITEAAWTPTAQDIDHANVTALMRELDVGTYEELHRWSVDHRTEFWRWTINKLGIRLRSPFGEIIEPGSGVEAPTWLPGAQLNIVESCFSHDPESAAVVHQSPGGDLYRWTLADLEKVTNRVVNGLAEMDLERGAAIAVDMPMTPESIAVYLGIIKAGHTVVSIADSFAAPEIAERLRLGNARLLFTQDVLMRGQKTLPLYGKVQQADAPRAIVIPAGESMSEPLRANDLDWRDFLSDHEEADAVITDPGAPINILFSSGTTGEPKAIPWTQTTPIKCAMDAYFVQDVHAADVLAWPSNLGWMMGPWLIFAALINKAALAVYNGPPTGRDFGEFVQDADVTQLGVVPSLVRTWRASQCMEGLDWSSIALFSSTGECSNAEDMLYLTQLAGNRPVLEYCGGTEVAGGYIGATVVKPAVPGLFNAVALGVDIEILDQDGQPADRGEAFLVPPSIGLSSHLLNFDHHEIYYSGTPAGSNGAVLRRHGDALERLPGGYYRAHGRADDTMNLAGIKVSSAEVEHVVNALPDVSETAAIAVPPSAGGPDRLVIFAVCSTDPPPEGRVLKEAMQDRIRSVLNPLFKIHAVVIAEALPRTASNKILRRVLRDAFQSGSKRFGETTT
ncbi:MAG: AMP-binding protein [Verrucomicrobia bacterium]|nr:AMP-binding protein [Verrucomicrobiota bacterium]MDA1087499.1 AMP-binding protein [Verrucomicrobiota bacterium]